MGDSLSKYSYLTTTLCCLLFQRRLDGFGWLALLLHVVGLRHDVLANGVAENREPPVL